MVQNSLLFSGFIHPRWLAGLISEAILVFREIDPSICTQVSRRGFGSEGAGQHSQCGLLGNSHGLSRK